MYKTASKNWNRTSHLPGGEKGFEKEGKKAAREYLRKQKGKSVKRKSQATTTREESSDSKPPMPSGKDVKCAKCSHMVDSNFLIFHARRFCKAQAAVKAKIRKSSDQY